MSDIKNATVDADVGLVTPESPENGTPYEDLVKTEEVINSEPYDGDEELSDYQVKADDVEEEIKDCTDRANDVDEEVKDCTDRADDAAVDDAGESDQVDPYAYTKNGSFTSEIFKIEIKNLPRHCSYKELSKVLRNQMKLDPCKIKHVKGQFAFVTFKSEADRCLALQTINGFTWRKQQLRALKAAPAPDPYLNKQRKRQNEETDCVEDSSSKQVKLDPDSLVQQLNDSVTPFWKVPYEQQLKEKDALVKKGVKQLGNMMERNNSDLKVWLNNQRKQYGGLCCCVEPIKPSPLTLYYRNKCEFTVGTDVFGQEKVVGFRLGTYRSGSVHTAQIQDCVHLPVVTKRIVQEVQGFLQTSSALPGWDPVTKTGNWRMVTVRSSDRTQQAMLIVHLNSEKINQSDVDEAVSSLTQFYTDKVTDASDVTSLYIELQEPGDEKGRPPAQLRHLLGRTQLEEQVLNMTFRISPTAFFQVNTGAAEVLYSLVKDLARPTKDMVILDVCCGTGTIGLLLARDVKKVIGIELCAEAIQDAQVNAKTNGIANVEFLCGKAEAVLPPMIGRLHREDVVAIVDPPRGGLNANVVSALRHNSFIKRLVYVSCQLSGATQNIVSLTKQTSRKYPGQPFKVLRLFAVDMFPQTDHFESVLLLERD